MIIERATTADIRQFYGAAFRCHAWVAKEGERVVAVAGYKIANAGVHVFAALNDEIRRYPKMMMRCGRELVREARGKGMPVHVIADYATPRSREFLERLGFKEQCDG